MRTLTLALCLGLLLLALLPTPLRAGDDDARLARRVEMLLDLVAEMRAEIADLEDRIAKLEAELREDVLGDEPLPPFTTVEPQPVPEDDPAEAPAPDVSGRYAMDRDASIKAVLERMSEGMDEDEIVAARMMVEEQYESIHMEVTLTKEGVFEASMKAPAEEDEKEGEEHSARGTWKFDATQEPKDGSTRLILETTHEDGEASKRGETIEGIWRPDGSLRLQQPDDDFVLIFRRT